MGCSKRFNFKFPFIFYAYIVDLILNLLKNK
jgi:hypothetical protein